MADAPTYADFDARFLKLSAADGAEEAWIAARLDEEWERTAGWGKHRTEATLLMVAHRFVLEVGDDDGRAVVSERVGGVSVSYAGSSSDDLDQTTYGRELAMLRRRSSGRLPLVAGRTL